MGSHRVELRARVGEPWYATWRWGRSWLLAAGLVGTLLAGCGGDDQQGAEETPSPSSPSTSSAVPEPTATPQTQKDVCDVISDDELSRWTGTEQRVGSARSSGPYTSCSASRAADDALDLDWDIDETDDSFASLVQTEADPGLRRAKLTLPGGVAAVRFEGKVADVLLARVVLKIDDKFLVIEAASSSAGSGPVPPKKLRRVATQIAAAYAERGLVPDG